MKDNSNNKPLTCFLFLVSFLCLSPEARTYSLEGINSIIIVDDFRATVHLVFQPSDLILLTIQDGVLGTIEETRLVCFILCHSALKSNVSLHSDQYCMAGFVFGLLHERRFGPCLFVVGRRIVSPLFVFHQWRNQTYSNKSTKKSVLILTNVPSLLKKATGFDCRSFPVFVFSASWPKYRGDCLVNSWTFDCEVEVGGLIPWCRREMQMSRKAWLSSCHDTLLV